MTNSQKVLAAIAGKFGTQDPRQLQIQRWQYYDYVRLNVAGVNRLTFMSNPLGSVDPVGLNPKTLEETNLRRSGELDLPFVIMQIKTAIQVLPAARQAGGVSAVTNLIAAGGLTPVMRALRNMANLGVLNVSFGQKNYFQIEQPFQKCPPGYGPAIVNYGATDTGTGTFMPASMWYTASVDPRDVYAVTPPVFIEKSQTLEATIDFYLANTPVIPQIGGADVEVQVGLIFDGYVVRPVQ